MKKTLTLLVLLGCDSPPMVVVPTGDQTVNFPVGLVYVQDDRPTPPICYALKRYEIQSGNAFVKSQVESFTTVPCASVERLSQHVKSR